jgi:hypothetical protein
MKHIALSCVLFIVLSAVHAQKDSIYQAYLNKKYGSLYIQLPSKPAQDVPPLFNAIQVIDQRTDTSRIGLATHSLSRGQIRFRPSASKALTNYFALNYTSPKGSRSLLVVIKDLWLFDDQDSTYEESFKRSVSVKQRGNIVFRCEAYLPAEDGYIPLTYLDTTVSVLHHTALNMSEGTLPHLLTIFMNKVAAVDIASVTERRRHLSYNAIDSFCRTRYNYVMDTATVLKRGVYRDAREFLDNTPSVEDCKLERTNTGEYALYVRENDGQYRYTHNMWGYCDGANCFVMMDGTLFQLLPVQHAFYVLGSKSYHNAAPVVPVLVPLPGALIVGTGRISTEIEKKLEIFRLDAMSGEIVR